MKMEETECFETSTYKIQKTGNYPEEILEFYNYLSVKMEQTECSETSTYKIQTPVNYHPEEILEFYNYMSMKMEQSVPKRRHIKFRRRGITQKKF